MKKNIFSKTTLLIFFSSIIFWSCEDIIEDQNNPPSISDQTFSINENSENGIVVDTVTASDQDEEQELFFSILTGNSTNAFKIDSITGIITVNDSSHLDFEVNPFFELGVSVTDNGETPLSSFATITITINDINDPIDPGKNHPPKIDDQIFSIPENSQNGTVIDSVSASDQNTEQKLTFYIMAGNAMNAFRIDAESGALIVNDSSYLDFEINASFELGIKVTDNGETPLSSFATVTINIDDVYEPVLPVEGLVAHYPFDGNAKDISKYCNHGVVHNAQLVQDRNSNPNSSYYFNGSNAYISVPSDPTLNPDNQLTINVWINAEELNNRYTPIIHKGGVYQDNFTNREYVIYIEDNKKVFAESSGDNKPHRILNAVMPKLNEWFMFTAVIDRKNHKMRTYIDGELRKEIDDDYSTFTNNSDSIRIASWVEENSSYAPFFKGKLDDIRIYNRALDAEEISLLFEE